MLRIGIVTATYGPSKNGVATSTSLLVRGLGQLGHEVRVFAPAHPGAEPEQGVYRLPSMRLGAPRDYPVLLPLSLAAGAHLPLRDLDLVHSMHPFVAGRIAGTWARRLGVPLAFTAHTQYHAYVHYAPGPATLTRWAVKNHVRQFAQRADLVLVPGRAMTETLRGYGYRGHVEIVPNPVDLSAFEGLERAPLRATLGVLPSTPLLVYVGRLAPEKNLTVLLEAFRSLVATRPECRLLLVGEGPSRAELEDRARGLPVRFAGAVAYERVPQVLAAADMFVTASTSEVLPMAFLESLAASTPLVAARSPAAADLIEPGVNGSLCDADAASLSQAMVRALEPEHLAALRAGAKRSAARFEVGRVSAALLGVYRALVKTHGVLA